jgi:acyl-CoA thioesterase
LYVKVGKTGDFQEGRMEVEQVREFLTQRNAFAREAGVEIEEMSVGAARCRMALTPGRLNPFGTAHAAAIFTLAETAFGAAANAAGQACVAANLSISYLRPGTGPELFAEAREDAAGGPLASFTVRVWDSQGQTIATAQALGYRRKQTLEEFL